MFLIREFEGVRRRKHLARFVLWLQRNFWAFYHQTLASTQMFWRAVSPILFTYLPIGTAALWFLIYGGLLALVILYLLIIYFVAPLGSVLFGLLTLAGIAYTLISGFVYFTTRTGYGRYTDISQRFWKRSFSYFWLIEIGLFACVVYLVLASPSETAYGYDTPAVFKLHFFALDDFIIRAIVFNALLLVIYAMIMVNYRGRLSLLLGGHFIVALLFFILFYIEFGIFQNYLNFVGFYKWAFSTDAYEANLESELARSRVLHGFVLLASIVKFWHFALIALVWFFYLARYFESAEMRETLLTSTFQSFLILYSLNFLMLAPHLKYLGRKYMSNPYYWFFETPDFGSLVVAFNFTKLFYTTLLA